MSEPVDPKDLQVTRHENLTVLDDRLEKVGEALDAGEKIEDALAEHHLTVKQLAKLPELPAGLRRSIKAYYATDDLTKAAARAKLLEVLDTSEDEKTRIDAAKALLADTRKDTPATQVGVVIQQPTGDIEALHRSVDGRDDDKNH